MGGFVGGGTQVFSTGFFGAPQAAPGWTAKTIEAPFGVYFAAAYAGAGTVVVANNNAASGFTTDGAVTWTNAAAGQFGSCVTPSGMVLEAGTLVLGAHDATGNIRIYTSVDNGVHWTPGQVLSPAVSPVGDSGFQILSNGVDLMVAGMPVQLVGGNYFTSTDHGATWTQHNILAGHNWGSAVSSLSGIWDGTQFVTFAYLNASPFTAKVATSPDGITWTTTDFTGALAGNSRFSIAFGNGVYVAGDYFDGDVVLVASTPAGLTVAPPTHTGLPAHVTGVFFDGTRFFAFDDSGAVASSLNGTAWTLENLNFNLTGPDVCGICVFDSAHKLNMAFNTVGNQGGLGGSISTRGP